MAVDEPKPVEWLGSSRADLKALSEEGHGWLCVVSSPGGVQAPGCQAAARFGQQCPGGARYDGDTFRAVYTIRFRGAVYVLHVFRKKSKRGIATPKLEIDLIRRRLRAAEKHYQENYGGG